MINLWMEFLGTTKEDTLVKQTKLIFPLMHSWQSLLLLTWARALKHAKAFEIPADQIPNGLFPHRIPDEYGIQNKIKQAMKPVGALWTYKLYKMHLYRKLGECLNISPVSLDDFHYEEKKVLNTGGTPHVGTTQLILYRNSSPGMHLVQKNYIEYHGTNEAELGHLAHWACCMILEHVESNGSKPAVMLKAK
jgi:hypothetical protein